MGEEQNKHFVNKRLRKFPFQKVALNLSVMYQEWPWEEISCKGEIDMTTLLNPYL